MKRFLVLVLLLSIIGSSASASASGKEQIEMSFVGDVSFTDAVARHIAKQGFSYPWEFTDEYFLNDDITAINLETSISKRGKAWEEKEFTFRSHPSNAEAMKEHSIEYVSLANNHTLDFNREGFSDTLKYLKENDIAYSGGGANLEEALKPAIFDIEGTKIGIIAYSRVIPSVKWYAGNNTSGLVGAYDSQLKKVEAHIADIKKDVDILILSVHWGEMYKDFPRVSERKAAKRFVDAGVDMIVGHHPHVLQGIELIDNKPVCYSLGNFVFTNLGGKSDNTMIVKSFITDGKITGLKLIPMKIEKSRPVSLSEKEKQLAIENIRKLSKGFGTTIEDDGSIKIIKK